MFVAVVEAIGAVYIGWNVGLLHSCKGVVLVEVGGVGGRECNGGGCNDGKVGRGETGSPCMRSLYGVSVCCVCGDGATSTAPARAVPRLLRCLLQLTTSDVWTMDVVAWRSRPRGFSPPGPRLLLLLLLLCSTSGLRPAVISRHCLTALAAGNM